MQAIQLLDVTDSGQVEKCFRVFAFLRPHLDLTEFVRRVQVQAQEGYRIAYVEVDGQMMAAAGYRVAHFLAWGRTLYIDDLITHPDAKRQGLGGALLDSVTEQARELGCGEVHLDTGYQRHDAHRLYLNKGFELGCHHLRKKVGD